MASPQHHLVRDKPDPTIRVVDSLPLQVRPDRIALSKFRHIRNYGEGWGPISVKPPYTGMWTSSYLPQTLSPSFSRLVGDGDRGICDWYRWCLAEDFRLWRWRYAYVYQQARPLRIIEIDTLDDLIAVNLVYGVAEPISLQLHAENPSHPITFYPDWERLAREFDAVHLTENGQWSTRSTCQVNLYGWDCESTLWLRLQRNSLRLVKKFNLGVGGRRPTRQDLRDRAQILRNQMRDSLEQMRQWKMEMAEAK